MRSAELLFFHSMPDALPLYAALSQKLLTVFPQLTVEVAPYPNRWTHHVMDCAKTHWGEVALRATSIGAWFSLLAFGDTALTQALFVSPVLDIERLIGNRRTP